MLLGLCQSPVPDPTHSSLPLLLLLQLLLQLLLCLQVIDRIMNDVLPVIRQSGLAGHAEYVTRSKFFSENPSAIDMLVDVLTDR